MSGRSILRNLKNLVRWEVWSHSKIPLFLVAMSYAVLRGEAYETAQLADMASLLALIILYASFGHIINDYSDFDIDRAAGKTKYLASLSRPAALTTVALFAGGPVLVALARFDTGTTALTAIALIAAASYSLPPLRLKERGILGCLSSSIAQRTLPLSPFSPLASSLGLATLPAS